MHEHQPWCSKVIAANAELPWRVRCDCQMKKDEFVAKALCIAAGHVWPCPRDQYSTKWANESVSKWWIEMADHAIDAVKEYEATHGHR